MYADLYGGAIWAGSETPENSGVFSPTLISFACSHDSPMNCSLVPGSSVPALGYIFSFGEDNNKDIYILASSGVYRVVPPSKCNISCSKENTSAVPSTQGSSGPVSSPPSEATLSAGLYNNLVVLLLSLCLVLVF